MLSVSVESIYKLYKYITLDQNLASILLLIQINQII